MGGVEVIQPGGDEGVRHPAEFLVIHMTVPHGQAHAAETEVAVDFRKKRILYHVPLLCHFVSPMLLSQFATSAPVPSASFWAWLPQDFRELPLQG